MSKLFKSFIPSEQNIKEFTLKSILTGCLFGVIFGAATVYLALKAGLTVSASIPIAVLSITLGRRFLKTTILENNIIQTTGSASESIAAGVSFTLPAFLFLSTPDSASYFNYLVILILAIIGGLLGTLMMVPLRKPLIVDEHETLPYPEGTACGEVLIAGEKGGSFAKTAFWGLGVSMIYAIFQKILHLIAELPFYITAKTNAYFPAAKLSGEITPEYMGVGYIIGPKTSGILVAGGILSWWVLIPLCSTLIPPDVIAFQLNKLGYLADLTKSGGKGGWDPIVHSFNDFSAAIYYGYIRQIGAGAVAAGGIITLGKTLPTIIKSIKESVKGFNKSSIAINNTKRTETDISLKKIGIGILVLIVIISILPQMPGDSIFQKIALAILIILFGALFVTVSSRIVGIIGSSNNPISGITIATVMGTSLIFLSLGWTGFHYEPLVLVVAGIICISAANAGATSQDLKSGYLVGSTPKYQQYALLIGVIVSSFIIGITIKFLDTPSAIQAQNGIQHLIGTEKYPAPQATLMATLIKGILSQNLDWQYIFAGVFLAITMELCGIKSLSFGVGVYLPLSTTLPIFIGGAIKGLVNAKTKSKSHPDDELSSGNLFATGLVAGGAIAGVIIAFLSGTNWGTHFIETISFENMLTNLFSVNGYFIFGTFLFAIMGFILYRIGKKV